MIPTKTEKPNGFHKIYTIARADGSPINPEAEFFVLRLDNKASNKAHINACRRAILAYADNIAATKPELAIDLYQRYNATVDSPPTAINPEPHI